MGEGHDPRDAPPSSEDESGREGVAGPDAPERTDHPAAGATVEPDLTADELEGGWGEQPHESGWSTDSDDWLLRERPPHWE